MLQATQIFSIAISRIKGNKFAFCIRVKAASVKWELQIEDFEKCRFDKNTFFYNIMIIYGIKGINFS